MEVFKEIILKHFVLNKIKVKLMKNNCRIIIVKSNNEYDFLVFVKNVGHYETWNKNYATQIYFWMSLQQ